MPICLNKALPSWFPHPEAVQNVISGLAFSALVFSFNCLFVFESVSLDRHFQSREKQKVVENCAKAVEAVRYFVLLKIGAQGSMNAVMHYRFVEASYLLTKNVAVFFRLHHVIFSKLHRNIL